MSPCPALQIDALPNSADRAVPALFAVGDFGEGELGKKVGIVARIDHPHDQLVGAIATKAVGHIELKGQVAALVLADLLAVEPHCGEVVHCSEVEHEAGGLTIRASVRQIEVTAIPGHAAVVSQVIELGLPGTRHPDLSPLVFPECGRGEILPRIGEKFPLAVEIGALTNHVVNSRAC